jgi:hypothetical protein
MPVWDQVIFGFFGDADHTEAAFCIRTTLILELDFALVPFLASVAALHVCITVKVDGLIVKLIFCSF